MSIEIEMRGARFRSVGRPLSVETAADRRLQATRTCLPAGQVLRAVLPRRPDQPSRGATARDGAGRLHPNLRAESLDEARNPTAGLPLEAKD
jgi:hypothetical protein